ncbi:NAD(P)H-hydrate dehydratase [Clostridium rectalis]|uniref:NAD(P)H-hydrate dehydratase n=1 Tax=Clostridium rectalis TaxID=2040295 RepID=UPI000F62E769|nr:NAD(P)H-hydrate dehydratase [Clostridium rectalis]
MKIGTCQVSKNIDKYCIEDLSIPSIVLMENAAIKIIKNIDLSKFNSFVIICGKGNNGGDGFAVARHLHILNKNIEVFLIGGDNGLSKDCEINYRILKNMGIGVNSISNIEDIFNLRETLEKSDISIDALFGTGLTRKIEGIYNDVISVINENSKYIISIDVPSGFQSNTGKILGNCIRANKTISFELYKKGFLEYGSDKLLGDIMIEKIGVPEFVINKFHEREFMLDKELVKKSIRRRDVYGHKGDYGRVLIIAGSCGLSGAAYISTQAAVRSGAGLVTLCSYEEIQNILSNKLIEAMTISFKDGDKLFNLFNNSNAIAIGPGLGNNETTFQLVKDTILNSNCPIILDADGINVLKNNTDLLMKKSSEIILTPHIGEMSKITGISIEYIKEHRLEVAKKFAKKYSVIVLLKGYNTIITDGDEMVINPTGNSSMASGGMGDCLTGIIASFIAQGYTPMIAACISAFIHGYTGEKLSKRMFCVNASHVLEELPFIIKQIQNL